MIRRASRLALIALVLGAAGADAQRPRGGMMGMAALLGPPGGDPSAIVAAEIAFSQLARTKGQWTAFRETADEDAVMFVPQIVNAQAWLRKRADPARAVTWSPNAVYMACDGSYAASTGSFKQPDGTVGSFVTLWRRQANGSYKWVIDWGGDRVDPKPGLGDDDDLVAIDGKVAECAARDRSADSFDGPSGQAQRKAAKKPPKSAKKAFAATLVRIAVPPPADGQGQSPDGSLRWSWTSGPGKPRTLAVSMRAGGEFRTVIDTRVAAAAP